MIDKRKFMIVDDDFDDREFFCEVLNELDASAECVMAIDGVDALRELRNNTLHLPDYIFLDLNMPRMDGRRCLMELKKDFQLQNIPVIIYTTSRQQEDKDELREMGAIHFITKPSEFKKLRDEIRFVINQNWSKTEAI